MVLVIYTFVVDRSLTVPLATFGRLGWPPIVFFFPCLGRWASRMSSSLPQKRARIAVLEEEVKASESTRERLESQLSSLEAARTGNGLTNGRDTFLTQLAANEQAVVALTAQVAEQAASDPERLQRLAEATKTAREAANRWTDNVDTLRRYVSDKFGMSSADFARQFGVPADLEYLEEEAPPQQA